MTLRKLLIQFIEENDANTKSVGNTGRVSDSYQYHVYTYAKVIIPDGETETLGILDGVLQGDTLVPYLFVIVF